MAEDDEIPFEIKEKLANFDTSLGKLEDMVNVMTNTPRQQMVDKVRAK